MANDPNSGTKQGTGAEDLEKFLDPKTLSAKKLALALELHQKLSSVPRALAHLMGRGNYSSDALNEYLAKLSPLEPIAPGFILLPWKLTAGTNSAKFAKFELNTEADYEPTKNYSLIEIKPEEWSPALPMFFQARKIHWVTSLRPLLARNGQIVGCTLSFWQDMGNLEIKTLEVEFPYAKWAMVNCGNANLALYDRESLYSFLPQEIKREIIKYLFVEKAGPCLPPLDLHMKFQRQAKQKTHTRHPKTPQRRTPRD